MPCSSRMLTSAQNHRGALEGASRRASKSTGGPSPAILWPKPRFIFDSPRWSPGDPAEISAGSVYQSPSQEFDQDGTCSGYPDLLETRQRDKNNHEGKCYFHQSQAPTSYVQGVSGLTEHYCSHYCTTKYILRYRTSSIMASSSSYWRACLL